MTGERALFHAHDLKICDTIFDDGESPLKESRNIELWGSMFKWKYPLWYCKLINTTLAFEYSVVDADITSHIDSVLNPSGGTIRAESIGELTIEKDKVDPLKTVIICRDAVKQAG